MEMLEFVALEAVAASTVLEESAAFLFLARIRQSIRSINSAWDRLMRHAVVYILMPAVNFVSHRCFVQHRPDGFADRFKELLPLQRVWEKGRRGNNRGDYVRLYFLLSNLEALTKDGVPGAFAELGVYKGTTARIMQIVAPDRELFLFDTFDGLPEQHVVVDPVSNEMSGSYAESLEEVRRLIGDADNIHYCAGIFPETAELVPPETSFALVHLDCDLYAPTKAALEFFYPRMNAGALLVLHDYHSGCWPGVTNAVNEFMADKPEQLILIPDKSGTAAFRRI
ncbi:MAG: TylF/MycF/NovP-related O-methyltransferase [Rhodospirillales bacterium]